MPHSHNVAKDILAVGADANDDSVLQDIPLSCVLEDGSSLRRHL